MARATHFAEADSCSLVIMATLSGALGRTRCGDTLPSLADEIVVAIAREVPDYARPMEGRFGETVRFGTQIALNRFVDLLVGDAQVDRARETYQRLGAGEYRQGRTLDALLAAYRVGARLAWRRFVDVGTQAGFPADALYDLGEAMFAYIDEISAESAAGFAEAQSEAAGESQRRRRRLLQLLVQEPAGRRRGRADRRAGRRLGAAAAARGGRRGRGRPARGPGGRARRGRAERGAGGRDRRASSRAGWARRGRAPRSAAWRS